MRQIIFLFSFLVLALGSNAQTYYLGAYKTVPAGGVTYETSVDVKIFGGRPNDLIFIMLPGTLYTKNCSSAPSLSTNMRTPYSTISAAGIVTIPTKNLVTGVYVICYRKADNITYTWANSTGNTKVKVPRTSIYRPLPLRVTFTIGGNASAARSSFSCCGPFTAGVTATCYISLADANGVRTGTDADTCDLVVCPVKDGAGNDIPLGTQRTLPVFEEVGLYSFTFNATSSGCAGMAGMAYKGTAIGGRSAYFTVKPAPAASNMGSSSCMVNALNRVLCNVTQRDAFGNPVKACNFDASGTILCTTIL